MGENGVPGENHRSAVLVNYAIMSQPVGEIRISRYFSRKNVTFRKMSLCQ